MGWVLTKYEFSDEVVIAEFWNGATRVEIVDELARDLTAMNVHLHRRRTFPEPAAFIAEVRARHGLSQREFAGALGLDLRTLQNWEQGRNRPDTAVLNLVALFDRQPILVEDTAFESTP